MGHDKKKGRQFNKSRREAVQRKHHGLLMESLRKALVPFGASRVSHGDDPWDPTADRPATSSTSAGGLALIEEGIEAGSVPPGCQPEATSARSITAAEAPGLWQVAVDMHRMFQGETVAFHADPNSVAVQPQKIIEHETRVQDLFATYEAASHSIKQGVEGLLEGLLSEPPEVSEKSKQDVQIARQELLEDARFAFADLDAVFADLKVELVQPCNPYLDALRYGPAKKETAYEIALCLLHDRGFSRKQIAEIFGKEWAAVDRQLERTRKRIAT